MSGAKNAYALLGISFAVVFGAAYVLFERAHAPTPEDEAIVSTDVSNALEESNFEDESMTLALTSPVFGDDGAIPLKYTCDGEDVSPELHIRGVPDGTEALVLVMDDPDAPVGTWAHWALYGIPASTTRIEEGTAIGSTGTNSWGTASYGGPCPPDKEHRYIFRLYAVVGQLSFTKTPTLEEVEEAAKGMMIESATLIGRYNRPGNALTL